MYSKSVYWISLVTLRRRLVELERGEAGKVKAEARLKEAHEHGHISSRELETCVQHINSARIKLNSHPYTETTPPIKLLVQDVSMHWTCMPPANRIRQLHTVATAFEKVALAKVHSHT